VETRPDAEQVATIPQWRGLASCARHTPDLFFPVGETGLGGTQIAMAKRICIGCPVRQECLDYALASNQRFGIWGGLTEEERRPVRRRWLMETRRLVS
jgi:WhiB family transcriptional regulator, redox-sensing transcriptional regulator